MEEIFESRACVEI